MIRSTLVRLCRRLSSPGPVSRHIRPEAASPRRTSVTAGPGAHLDPGLDVKAPALPTSARVFRLEDGRRVSVRRLVREDEPALVAFLQKMRDDHPGDYARRFPVRLVGSAEVTVALQQATPSEVANVMKRGGVKAHVMLDEQDAVVALVDYDARPVLGLFAHPWACEANMIVDKGFQNAEVGRRMLEQALRGAHEDGFRRLEANRISPRTGDMQKYVIALDGTGQLRAAKPSGGDDPSPAAGDDMPGAA